MNQYRELTPEQLAVLQEYASQNGRTWKSKLWNEWMNATASWPLMQIRNQFGPSWLVRFRLPKNTPERTPRWDESACMGSMD